MNRVDVEISGIDGVLDMLKNLPPEVVSKRGGPVKKALRKAAVIIQKEAQKNIRNIVLEPNKDGRPTKSTGSLEKAVTVGRGKYMGGSLGERYMVWLPREKRKYANTKENVRKRRVGKTYTVESPQFYGRFLEYGTSKMQKKPWLRPALMSKGDQAIAVARDALLKEIERVTQKMLGKK
jgi:HK97 gp10 family phage protein